MIYTPKTKQAMKLCYEAHRDQTDKSSKIVDRFVDRGADSPGEKNMIIETERLRLHAASLDEMTRFIKAQTNETLITAYKEMLQGCLDHPQEWDWYAIWFIELKNGDSVGNLCFKGICADESVEIGYGVSEEMQGNGYATEAVNAVTVWALEQPGVCRVEAETEPDNAASQRVLEKCGFLPSGIMGEEGPRFYKTDGRASG